MKTYLDKKKQTRQLPRFASCGYALLNDISNLNEPAKY